MDEEKDIITITFEDGRESECEVLFTYHSDEFNKDYVVFSIEENDEVSAACYEPNEDDEEFGTLSDIETDAEWDMLDKLLESYDDEDEEE